MIPADTRNANIITIFKKNDRHNVKNYRGISLRAVVGKIMALVMLNRMRDPITETVLPESQCGFRRNRGTTDIWSSLSDNLWRRPENNTVSST